MKTVFFVLLFFLVGFGQMFSVSTPVLAGQPTINNFEGEWRGMWINMLRSTPIGVRANLDIQQDGSYFYSHSGSEERGIKSGTSKRTGAVKDGKFVFETKDRTVSFEVMQIGCQDEDPARPGHSKDVPGPCLHGRDSKHLNAHGYFFRRSK